MTLFDELPPKLKAVLDWFKTLPTERQISLITEAFKDFKVLPKNDAEKLGEIFAEVGMSLASHRKEDVIKRLVDLGVDDTLTRIIVEKVSSLRPDPMMCAQALKNLSDEKFREVINEVVVTFFLDWRSFDLDEISKKLAVDTTVIRSAVSLLRDTVVWEHLRGHLSLKAIREKFAKNYSYPLTKIDILSEILQKNGPEIRLSLMFGMIQDMSFELSKITNSLAEVLSTLKELIQIIKRESKGQYVA